MGKMTPMQHWTLTRDSDGLARLVFDRAGASANTLGAPVQSEAVQNWTITRQGDGLATLTFDRVGETTNTLSQQMLVERT